MWKKSIQFVKKIYKITSKFPDAEKYGLTNQMRRFAVSIPSNITEGAGRNSKNTFWPNKINKNMNKSVINHYLPVTSISLLVTI